MPVNAEIKARCSHPHRVRDYLVSQKAFCKGLDHQVDTYFNVPYGRLKLRRGLIENALIHYHRPDGEGPKSSHVTLFPTDGGDVLLGILSKSLGVKTVVDKKREIWFIGEVKFHIDSVDGLGDFVEIEVIDADGDRPFRSLLETCRRHMEALGIDASDLVSSSYSDMMLERT